MSLTDDTADAIILRWPTPQQPVAPNAKPTWRERLDCLALPIFIIRLAVECLGWVALVGIVTML